MKIEIYYMTGAGNYFTVIDNRIKNFDIEMGKKLAPILCSEENGFASEGLMFLNNNNSEFDFTCDYFNPDGSYGMMCGNGGRCVARLANKLIGFDKKTIKFFMANNAYTAEFKISNIKLKLPAPVSISEKSQIKIENDTFDYNYVDLSSDHCVINVEDLKSINVDDIGSKIRSHSSFAPNGTNVDFYEMKEGKAHLRTFERGVEKETGSCGTGAIATALIANKNNDINFPIRVVPTSQNELIIDVDLLDITKEISYENIKVIYLEGNALLLDKKVVEINL